MKTLRLPLTRKWFDLTKSGMKTEDYREINEYWFKRLICLDYNELVTEHDIAEIVERLSREDNAMIREIYQTKFKKFDFNTMTLGYPKSTDKERTLILEHKGIEIRIGNPEWGAEPGKMYFVIKHGKIL